MSAARALMAAGLAAWCGGAAAQTAALDCPGPGCPAAADGAMSSAEIAAQFERQRELLAECRSGGGDAALCADQGLTRGIVIGAEPHDPTAPEAGEDLPRFDEDARIEIALRFRLNSAEPAEGSAALEAMCRPLRGIEGRVAVVGHTDAAGAADYNLALSERRARATIELLAARCGVARERLVAYGLGESRPLPGIDPFDPRQRRVEFIVLG